MRDNIIDEDVRFRQYKKIAVRDCKIELNQKLHMDTIGATAAACMHPQVTRLSEFRLRRGNVEGHMVWFRV